jgi:amidohydrolase
LGDYPVKITKDVGNHGIVALLEGKGEGPTVGYRADMDALPIQESTGLAFSSEHPGVMHACGHDGHMALALGLIDLLSQNTEHLKGSVKFLFQAAEETSGGALPMIRDGALESPSVQAMIGCHLWPSLPIGTLGMREGPMMAGTDIFTIHIQGRGGHVGYPDQAVNPVVVAAKLVDLIEGIKNYELPSHENAVITIGAIQAGTVNNIIPDHGKLLGTVRTFTSRAQGIIRSALERICRQVGALYGAEITLTYKENFPPTLNDPEIVRKLKNAFPPDRAAAILRTPSHPSMAAEDFAYFAKEVPSAFIWLGIGSEKPDKGCELHHPAFDFDESVFSFALPILADFLATLLRARK